MALRYWKPISNHLDGKTPLMCAAAAGALDAVDALLEAGANPTATTEDGRSAADWAEASGHDDVVSRLNR